MARWKLSCPHYLYTVKSAKWRYSHTDRATGDLVEKEFIVPRLLDPRDPKCWTNKFGGIPVSRGGNDSEADGEVVVCFQGKGEPGDIEIVGDPTPDMIPLDEEAQEISDSFQDHWAYKPDNAEVNFSQAIVDRSNQMVEAIESASRAPIQVEGLSDLVNLIAAQMQQNQALLQALGEQHGKGSSRV